LNGRQAAKLAAKKIEEQEYMLGRYKQDVIDYNACIQGVIAGMSVCGWCEEHEECKLDAKDGSGCAQWWLRYRKEDRADAGEGVPASGAESGT